MTYIIVVPFSSQCTTYLADAGYKGVTLCYRKADALEFDAVEYAVAALEIIKAPTTAYIERKE